MAGVGLDFVLLAKTRADHFAELTGGKHDGYGWVELPASDDGDLRSVAFSGADVYLHTYISKACLTGRSAVKWVPYIAKVLESHPDTEEHLLKLERMDLESRLERTKARMRDE